MSLHFEDTRDNRKIGILLIILTSICFGTLDSLAKLLVKTVPVTEVVWMRFASQFVLMCIFFIPKHKLALIQVNHPKIHLLRALLLGGMTSFNFTALQYLELSQAAAIEFTVPIIVALISVHYLKETLGFKRWSAIFMGFLGVLIIVRPGTNNFHPAIFLSILNAIFYAIFLLLTRHVTIKDSPEQSQFLPIGGVVLMLLPFLIHKWVMPPDLLTWTLLITCGILGGIGHMSLAHAHRYASSSTLGPFLYQKIIYMILWGWIFFNQLPDLTATIGTIIVGLGGLYLVRHEMKFKI